MANKDWREILVEELQNDPLGRGYTNMSDQQVADSLNEPNRTRLRSVPVSEFINYLYEVSDASNISRMRLIKQGRETATSPVAELAADLVDLLQEVPQLDMTVSEFSNRMDVMLQSLVDGGLLLDAEKTDLMGKGEEVISRAQEIGFIWGGGDEVEPHHIANARRQLV